jgi:porin
LKLLAGAIAAATLGVQPALADPAQQAPPVTFQIANTLDLWRNVRGGLKVGYTSLDKLQLSATLDGEALGRPGFKAHLFVFKTNGESLSGSRTGDIQTASNVEALSVTRLFELWAEQQIGQPGAGGVALRGGFLDLNATFDSIATAGLFLNSSHGIAPDLSASGRNGPSIFPVSSLGAQLAWTPTKALTVNVGAFGGVPGDLSHPKAFAAARLSAADGALVIAQVDRALGEDTQVSVGAWAYTADLDSVSGVGRHQRGRPGVYAFVDAPARALGRARMWIRAGVADGRVQPVAAYLGGGLVWTGGFAGRADDQFGLAIAHAFIGEAAQHALDAPAAETTFEATYSYKLNAAIRLQPDVQYIVHPALGHNLPNALALGLRVSARFNDPPGGAD